MKEKVLITIKWRLRLRIYGGAVVELLSDDKQARRDTPVFSAREQTLHDLSMDCNLATQLNRKKRTTKSGYVIYRSIVCGNTSQWKRPTCHVPQGAHKPPKGKA
jgi:hypothetical protein